VTVSIDHEPSIRRAATATGRGHAPTPEAPMSKLEDYANKYRTIRRERRNGIFGSPARASAHR